jgi:hypothetical protein
VKVATFSINDFNGRLPNLLARRSPHPPTVTVHSAIDEPRISGDAANCYSS